ncbi:MAG: HutD family protein [Tissierellia bacterium]|nr:HutD family protein [Tissierellia bacterium]
MKSKIISWKNVQTTDWSGGTTSEILILPEGASASKRDFQLRISTATCELEESVFSDYSGFTRFIAPIDGTLDLSVNGESVHLQPFEVFRFRGSDKVIGHSQVRDYNLICLEELDHKLECHVISEGICIKWAGSGLLLQSFDGDFFYRYGEQEGRVRRLDALYLFGDDSEIYLEAPEGTHIFSSFL